MFQHHDHEAVDMADLVMDTEHMLDDMGELYSQQELKRMELDEKVFLWFQAHDWDQDSHMDGTELLKALR
jgi:hypothetical protein